MGLLGPGSKELEFHPCLGELHRTAATSRQHGLVVNFGRKHQVARTLCVPMETVCFFAWIHQHAFRLAGKPLNTSSTANRTSLDGRPLDRSSKPSSMTWPTKIASTTLTRRHTGIPWQSHAEAKGVNMNSPRGSMPAESLIIGH
jgi:hypothetical protein